MFDMQNECGGALESTVHSVPVKNCTRCCEVKLLKEFHKDRRTKDGRQLWCKVCKSEVTKAWAKKNRSRKNRTDATFKRGNGRSRDRAHCMVKRAIKRGELKPLWRCENCCTPGPVEAHHTDYTKPLDVVWLCLTCHGQAHSKEGLS